MHIEHICIEMATVLLACSSIGFMLFVLNKFHRESQKVKQHRDKTWSS